ncbi:MAG: DoxX family protein [Kofleriaceae bacterium]
MSMNPGIAERLAFGRPLTVDNDPVVHSVPRPGTALAGRILLSLMFFVSGVAKLTDVSGTAAHMTAVGIPEAETLAIIAGIAEVLGALSIASGFLARIGGMGLVLFLIPTTILFHPFWSFEGRERIMQMANFLKNCGMAGGLLMIVANGAGRYSIDAAIRRPQEP